MNQRFSCFYKELYTSDFKSTPSQTMLSKMIRTPLLSTEEATSLGAQISLNELKRALDSTNKGKLPGWDESIEAADKAIQFLLCYFYYPWNPCPRQFINRRKEHTFHYTQIIFYYNEQKYERNM
ncbi:unnamed protein product [Oncorhynchus mykiss]|uniref:Uncharacterized protein n=1 Tax=Oncorhynchus mykiss TaxID=8022 RepID=A0A060W8X8_ONCMY|nr:unnamed protein product [Oncorhynchus mykiss]